MKKLNLNKESLRNLTPEALEQAHGGVPQVRRRSARCTILSDLCPNTDDTWGTALCPDLPKTLG